MRSDIERYVALRLCPLCGRPEPIESGEIVWPTAWRCTGCGETVPSIDGIAAYAPQLAGQDSGFKSAHFDKLVAHEPGHYWFEPRNRLLIGLADRYFPAAKRFLEIGCGSGFVLSAFERARRWESVTGSELHPAGLSHARRRLEDRAGFVQMDARHIPARSAFDLVGAFDVLEHIPEDTDVMLGVHEALAPGGGFIVAVPQHPALWSHADEMACHVRRYRRGEMEAKLEGAGFEVLFSTSYTALLLPLMILSRIRRNDGTIEEHLRREFDVSRFLNSVFRALLSFEVALSLKGLTWPLGGSRVVVARKSTGSRDCAHGSNISLGT